MQLIRRFDVRRNSSAVTLMTLLTIIFMTSSWLSACKTPDDQSNVASADHLTLEENNGTQLVNILYGTSRKLDKEALQRGSLDDLEKAYGADRIWADTGDDKVDKNNYGMLSVNIPRYHTPGSFEHQKSSWVFGKEAYDADKHFKLVRLRRDSLADFKKRLGEAASGASKKSILIFVHGFNVSFAEGATGFAQMIYDMDYPGIPLYYSWASAGLISAYTNDEETVRFAELPFLNFLEKIRQDAPDAEITIFAHSMGSRLMLGTLSLLRQRYLNNPQPLFNHVVLAAPDVDSSEFRQVYSSVQGLAKRWTLYANENDIALAASIKAHYIAREITNKGISGRAGLGGDRIVVMPGLESVDLSNLKHDTLAHATYQQNATMLNDLRDNIVLDKSADDRKGLATDVKVLNNKRIRYWFFRDMQQ